MAYSLCRMLESTSDKMNFIQMGCCIYQLWTSTIKIIHTKNNGIEDWVKREVFTIYVQWNCFRSCTARIRTTDSVHFLFTAYPVQCYWQFHSGQLVGLSKLPPVSSMLALQLFAPDPLSVATQLAYLLGSLGSLSRAWAGCSRDLEWDPGWIWRCFLGF